MGKVKKSQQFFARADFGRGADNSAPAAAALIPPANARDLRSSAPSLLEDVKIDGWKAEKNAPMTKGAILSVPSHVGNFTFKSMTRPGRGVNTSFLETR